MSDYVFTPLSAATGGAGSYVDSSWRIVLHTTEIDTKPSNWIPNFQYPSHVVCSYEHNEIYQLIGFNEAGKALYHAPGGVETNRMGAIQIEINGHADDAGNWSQDKLRWIGEKVLKPICDWIDANGGGFNCYNIPAPGAHGGSASDTAPQRMSYETWTNFNGICGHRHVPDNDHYDPDQLNVPQIVAYANAGELTVSYTKSDTRIDLVGTNNEGHVYHKWFDTATQQWYPGKANDLGGWEWITQKFGKDELCKGNVSCGWYGEQFQIFWPRSDGQVQQVFFIAGQGWAKGVINGGVTSVATAVKSVLVVS